MDGARPPATNAATKCPDGGRDGSVASASVTVRVSPCSARSTYGDWLRRFIPGDIDGRLRATRLAESKRRVPLGGLVRRTGGAPACA